MAFQHGKRWRGTGSAHETHAEPGKRLFWPPCLVTSGRFADDEPAAEAEQTGAALCNCGRGTECPTDDPVVGEAVFGKARELGGITECNSDVTSEFEISDSGVEEADAPLRPVHQHELDAGSLECHDQSRYSPTAPEIAPTLAGHRLGHGIMSPRMPDMRQQVAWAQKTLTLAAAKHGEQAVIRCRHDASHRISRVSRETLPNADLALTDNGVR